MATLSAKEAALELGTNARTFRKFMRAITPKDDQPGQGNRYAIEAGDMKKLKKQFADWNAPKVKEQSTNGSAPVMDDDEEILDDIELDAEADEDEDDIPDFSDTEEPDEEELLALDDEDPDLEEDIEELS